MSLRLQQHFQVEIGCDLNEHFWFAKIVAYSTVIDGCQTSFLTVQPILARASKAAV
jgi:hypothetical protein